MVERVQITDRNGHGFTVIHLWQPEVECGICKRWGNHRHAVGWYCGPVEEDIGEHVPEWGPDAIAGGKTVCKQCHDEFYGFANTTQREHSVEDKP